MIIKFLSIIAITAAAIASIFMTSFSFVETSFADKGGKPNDNAIEGDNPDSFSKPCENFDDKRHVKLDEKLEENEGDDRNPGLLQAHENTQDGKGVDDRYC
jgi:hypothetical protein